MGHIPGQIAPLLRCNQAGRHKCCGFCRNAVNDAQSDTAAPAADIAFVGMRMIVKHGRVKFNLVPVDIDNERAIFIATIGIPASEAFLTSSSTNESSLLRSSSIPQRLLARNSSGKAYPCAEPIRPWET